MSPADETRLHPAEFKLDKSLIRIHKNYFSASYRYFTLSNYPALPVEGGNFPVFRRQQSRHFKIVQVNFFHSINIAINYLLINYYKWWITNYQLRIIKVNVLSLSEYSSLHRAPPTNNSNNEYSVAHVIRDVVYPATCVHYLLVTMRLLLPTVEPATKCTTTYYVWKLGNIKHCNSWCCLCQCELVQKKIRMNRYIINISSERILLKPLPRRSHSLICRKAGKAFPVENYVWHCRWVCLNRWSFPSIKHK